MTRPYRIGVVGFGVAGATASFLLARAGHQVSLFERAPRVGPVGAGILLQPSGQAVLRRLNLLERVTARAEPIAELHALRHDGRTLVRLPYAEVEAGCMAYGVHRGDLFAVLHDEVHAAGAQVFLNHDMRGYRKTADHVYIGDSAGHVHGPFDFLLVADGSRSLLRGDCRLTKWVHEYAHGALWALGPCAAVRGRLHQVTLGTRQLLGLLPMGEGRCSLFWSLRRDEHAAFRKRGLAPWKDEVLRLCPLADELLTGIDDLERINFTTYQHVWMRKWHDERVLFLGDAAHAMSPHLGQGINLALLDAFTFAQALKRVGDYRRAFVVHTRQRARHLRYYAFVTALLTPFFQSNGVVKGWGRDGVLPWLPRLPWVRRQMLLTMAGLKRDFLGGRIEA